MRNVKASPIHIDRKKSSPKNRKLVKIVFKIKIALVIGKRISLLIKMRFTKVHPLILLKENVNKLHIWLYLTNFNL